MTARIVGGVRWELDQTTGAWVANVDGQRWQLDQEDTWSRSQWCLTGPGRTWVPIDRYLDSAMEWVVSHEMSGS